MTPFTQADGLTSRYIVYTYLFTADDNGAPFNCPQLGDKTVQVSGDLGGGTVLIEGSLDGINWDTLHDTSDNALSFNAHGISEVKEATVQMRASISGASSPSAKVVIFTRGG